MKGKILIITLIILWLLEAVNIAMKYGILAFILALVLPTIAVLIIRAVIKDKFSNP